MKYNIITLILAGLVLSACNKENPEYPDATFELSSDSIFLGEDITIRVKNPSAEMITLFSGIEGRKYSEFPKAEGAPVSNGEITIQYYAVGEYTLTVLARNYGNWSQDVLTDIKEKTIQVVDRRTRIRDFKVFQRAGVIDELKSQIILTVWTTEDKTSVIPEFLPFSPGAKVLYNGSEIVSKTTPVDLSLASRILTVVPPAGEGFKRDYEIVVVDYQPNFETLLLSLVLQTTPEFTPDIDHEAGKIIYNVPYGWGPTRVRVGGKASPGATIKWGTLNVRENTTNLTINFGNSIVVTAENLTDTRNYAFEINKGLPFVSFSFSSLNPSPAGIIEHPATLADTGLITVDVLAITNVSNLVASFTGNEASVTKVNGANQVSGVTANDFSSPLIYQVVPDDKSNTLIYKVVVNKK